MEQLIQNDATDLKIEMPRGENSMLKLLKRVFPPLAVFLIFISVWELFVWLKDIPPYILPGPSDIFLAVIDNWSNLRVSVATTITEALLGFVASIILGVSFAVLLALSKTVERSVFPYAIVMQTIPIVAIAPIIVIWFGSGLQSIVIIAFLMSFFPIFSNTLIGLNSTDQSMTNLFYLYNATKWQTIWKLRLPAALPYIMAGLKISCSMSVIASIVGEYIAGIGGGKGGLGYAVTIAASRLQVPYLFACGLSASVLGIAFFLIINAISKRMMSSWHESAM
jgi:NitT/TauT family transport system permease protein